MRCTLCVLRVLSKKNRDPDNLISRRGRSSGLSLAGVLGASSLPPGPKTAPDPQVDHFPTAYYFSTSLNHTTCQVCHFRYFEFSRPAIQYKAHANRPRRPPHSRGLTLLLLRRRRSHVSLGTRAPRLNPQQSPRHPWKPIFRSLTSPVARDTRSYGHSRSKPQYEWCRPAHGCGAGHRTE